MPILNMCRNMLQYNQWANEAYGRWLVEQPEEKLHQELESSFKSIDLTIQHMTRTQRFWLEFVKQTDLSGFDWRVKTQATALSMSDLMSSSEDWLHFLDSCSEEHLLESLHLKMPWAENRRYRYEYLLHMVNHGSFHRGQIVTMARSLGIKENIPATDLNIFNCLPPA